MKILEVRAVPAAEAKEVLLAREKEKELGYEQKLAAEHLKKFARLKAEDSKKLVSELDSVVKMSPDTLAQVVNLLPKTAEELRLIFAKEKFNPSEEEIKKILDAVKKVA
ncbi:MAG TPA: RNA polymerase Rpb4 family protein [archaeon]|nr:RNA polymerase Rpb4 family protein [archaeon]